VADIKVVEGPSMIKSENGRLRAYVRLTVRNRDEIGFVELSSTSAYSSPSSAVARSGGEGIGFTG
jgi:Cu/Ag efflux pump CusA